MAYADDIIKLRRRVQDAVVKGVVGVDGKDILEASFIQIMNDAERNRQNCMTQAENLRRQAAVLDGQASAFGSVTTIVYNVLNGFVTAAERDEEERARKEAEEAEAAEQARLESLAVEAVEEKEEESQSPIEEEVIEKVQPKKRRTVKKK
jgi:hypothetical protein